MTNPVSVAVTGTDQVLVADSSSSRVVHFSASGVLVAVFPFSSVSDVFVDAADHVYVCDTKAKQVYKLDINGTLLLTFSSNNDSEPEHIGVSPRDNSLYVTELYQRSTYQFSKFAADGTFLYS